MINIVGDFFRGVGHWLSGWLAFSPILVGSVAQHGGNRASDKNAFLAKVLVAIGIQIVTGIVSVAIGSYVTLQIINNQVQSVQSRQREVLSTQHDLTQRVGKNENDIAIIKERNRIRDSATATYRNTPN